MAESRIAVVTGATGSLASSVTKELLKHGIHVIVTYRTEESLEVLRNDLGALASHFESRKADVTDEKEVADLFEAVKREHGRSIS